MNEYFEGEVTFDLRGNSELGIEPDYVNFLNQGVAIDYAIIAPSNLARFAPSVPLMDMPFVFRVLTGWMPGGLGQVNVAVSMLFAGISGSSTADDAGCGKILIPAMIKKGYSPRFAVAITACSSVMGVIIPPSILYETGRFSSISLFAIGTASAFGWMLSFYNVPRLIVGTLTALEFDAFGTSLIIAALFLLFGLFIDAIPAIIILGTVLLPVAQPAGIHPVAFAIIGIISLAFGLVTPPYGLCLLISASIANINVVQVLRDVVIVLIPMLLILLLIIVFPEIALWLPKTLMPATFK